MPKFQMALKLRVATDQRPWTAGVLRHRVRPKRCRDLQDHESLLNNGLTAPVGTAHADTDVWG